MRSRCRPNPIAFYALMLAIGLVLGWVMPVRAEELDVRLTYYVEAGTTYSGEPTYWGSAACSWNLAYGTVLEFRDGERVRCNDRGMLGWSGWVDVFRQPYLQAKYGTYTTVTIVQEGPYASDESALGD